VRRRRTMHRSQICRSVVAGPDYTSSGARRSSSEGGARRGGGPAGVTRLKQWLQSRASSGMRSPHHGHVAVGPRRRRCFRTSLGGTSAMMKTPTTPRNSPSRVPRSGRPFHRPKSAPTPIHASHTTRTTTTHLPCPALPCPDGILPSHGSSRHQTGIIAPAVPALLKCGRTDLPFRGTACASASASGGSTIAR
jgi:hypothetical protein